MRMSNTGMTYGSWDHCLVLREMHACMQAVKDDLADWGMHDMHKQLQPLTPHSLTIRLR